MAHTSNFYGGLIYYGKPSSALAKCSCIIADTLEEYGHTVDQFNARDSDVIALACDQYRLVLRMGEPPRATDRDWVQPGLQRIEIELSPNFPTHCDSELSEMMMAIMLYRLVTAMGAEQVEWMDPNVTITRSQFLGVFADIRPLQQHHVLASDRFAPIEETAAALDLHFSAIQIPPQHLPKSRTKAAPYQGLAAWAGGLMRSNEAQFVTRVPPLAACAVLLQSSGLI